MNHSIKVYFKGQCTLFFLVNGCLNIKSIQKYYPQATKLKYIKDGINSFIHVPSENLLIRLDPTVDKLEVLTNESK